MQIRKSHRCRGDPGSRPSVGRRRQGPAIAVIANPMRVSMTRSSRSSGGGRRARRVLVQPRSMGLGIDGRRQANGRPAIAATNGEREHAAAVMPPPRGKPVRNRAGESVIASPKDRRAGDDDRCPLHHKTTSEVQHSRDAGLVTTPARRPLRGRVASAIAGARSTDRRDCLADVIPRTSKLTLTRPPGRSCHAARLPGRGLAPLMTCCQGRARIRAAGIRELSPCLQAETTPAGEVGPGRSASARRREHGPVKGPEGAIG